MITVEIPMHVCPNCNSQNDAATNMRKARRPKPGDFNMCTECGHLMAYADDLSHRCLTDAEIVALAGDPEMIRLQKVRRMLSATFSTK